MNEYARLFENVSVDDINTVQYDFNFLWPVFLAFKRFVCVGVIFFQGFLFNHPCTAKRIAFVMFHTTYVVSVGIVANILDQCPGEFLCIG